MNHSNGDPLALGGSTTTTTSVAAASTAVAPQTKLIFLPANVNMRNSSNTPTLLLSKKKPGVVASNAPTLVLSNPCESTNSSTIGRPILPKVSYTTITPVVANGVRIAPVEQQQQQVVNTPPLPFKLLPIGPVSRGAVNTDYAQEKKTLSEEIDALKWLARRKEQEWDSILKLLREKETKLSESIKKTDNIRLEKLETNAMLKMDSWKDDTTSGDQLCQACHTKQSQFVCAGCTNQWYCSRECQTQHWEVHAEQCNSEPIGDEDEDDFS